MCRIRSLLLLIAVAVCVAMVSLYIYSRLLTKRAEALVQATYELSNLRDGPLTLAVLQSRFGGQLRPMEGCAPSQCSYEVFLSNRGLASLKIVPYTELVSQFWVRDGVIGGNMLDFTTRVHNRYSIVVHAQTDFNDADEFYLHPWGDSTPMDTNGLVAITAGAPLEKKKIALAFNLSCLIKIGGCSTVADLLPTVWQLSANGNIDARIQNHEGFIDAPTSMMH